MTTLDLVAVAVLGLAVVIALANVANQLGRIAAAVDRLERKEDIPR